MKNQLLGPSGEELTCISKWPYWPPGRGQCHSGRNEQGLIGGPPLFHQHNRNNILDWTTERHLLSAHKSGTWGSHSIVEFLAGCSTLTAWSSVGGKGSCFFERSCFFPCGMHATAVQGCVELVEVLDSLKPMCTVLVLCTLEFQAYLFQHRYQPPAVSSLHPCQNRKLIMLALWRTESRECQLPDPVTGLNALLLVEGAGFPKEVGQSLILCSWQAWLHNQVKEDIGQHMCCEAFL